MQRAAAFVTGLLAAGLTFGTIAKAEIVIGTAGPMAGQYSSFGNQLRTGAAKAVADINANGGVNGQLLRLEVADDGCTEDGAIAAANQLVGKGAVFVAGHFCSVSSIPAAQVYHDNAILQISPASSDPRYTELAPGPGILRMRPRDDQQGTVAGEVLSRLYPAGSIGIVHDRSTYGEGLATRVRQAMYGAGLIETFFIGFDSKDVDYTDLVERMRERAVDAVYFGGYHTEAGLLAREMRAQGMDAVLVGGDTLYTDEFWTIARDAGQGTLMTFSMEPRNRQSARELVLEFETEGTDPIGFTIDTYTAVMVWAAAANDAGTTDVNAVAEALRARTFDTPLGPVAFDEKGDPANPQFDWYEWRNQRPAPWAAPEAETAEDTQSQ